MKYGTWAIGAIAAVLLAGCETPSQKYGLPPPDPNAPYPNITAVPSVSRETSNMRPIEVLEAEERLDRDARRAAAIPPARVAPLRR